MLSSRAPSGKPLAVPSRYPVDPLGFPLARAAFAGAKLEDTRRLKQYQKKHVPNLHQVVAAQLRRSQEQVVAEECDLIIFD
jgi:hypothetical protein